MVLGIVAGTPCTAATVGYLTDGQLVAAAQRVVYGRIAAVRTEAGAGGRVYTVATVDLFEDLTGVPGSRVEIRELGGKVGASAMVVSGLPAFSAGAEILACLEPTPDGRAHRLLALGFSLFSVSPDQARLLRQDQNLVVLDRPAVEGGSRTLSEFRRVVQAVRGTVPVTFPGRARASAPSADARLGEARPPGSQAQPPAGDAATERAFTLLGGGVRWNEVDAGQPISWSVNASAPAPVDGSDGTPEILTALAAWTTPGTAAITLTYAGVKDIGDDSPWCGDSNIGSGLISYEDPTDEIAAGVLAMGGGCTATTARVTLNGVTFDRLTHAFAVLNRSSEVGPTYRTRLNFGRLVEHEVGHGIGLGHTVATAPGAQNNIMYASCCYGTTPVPPSLGPDDLAGVEFIYPVEQSERDSDGDAMPDTWETAAGLDPFSAAGIDGAAGDADGDGFTNFQEYRGGGHPRGFHKTYLAEGAGGAFFASEIAVMPATAPARASYLVREVRTTPAASPSSCQADHVIAVDRWSSFVSIPCGDGTGQADVSTMLESDVPLVVERTMTWPVPAVVPPDVCAVPDPSAYGAHAEGGFSTPRSTWYFAEGATHSGFDLFYLVRNVEAAPISVRATYLRPAPLAPLTRHYVVDADSRLTIWVNHEGAELSSTDLGAVFASEGPRFLVERSMYASSTVHAFSAGSSAMGSPEPLTRWLFAEGATGPYFDTYLLLSNPGDQPAEVEARFLLSSGPGPARRYVVPPTSRVTVSVDGEGGELSDEAMGAELESVNGIPFVAERAMWWPGASPSTWTESHAAAGAADAAAHWISSDGEVGGARAARTYLLVVNPDVDAVSVAVQLKFDAGASPTRTLVVPGRTRRNIDVAEMFPEAQGLRFAADLQVQAPSNGRVVVERSTYWDGDGQPWAAGVTLRATPVP
jgi:hypothetical protein